MWAGHVSIGIARQAGNTKHTKADKHKQEQDRMVRLSPGKAHVLLLAVSCGASTPSWALGRCGLR